MKPIKWVLLLSYLAMAGCAVLYAETGIAAKILWIFALLAVVHFVKFLAKRKTLQNADGTMAHHFIQTMLFGVAHWRPLEKS